MRTLTKADLALEVSAVADVTVKDAEILVETMLNGMVRSLQAGEKIEIRGFGSFRTRPRKARIGRNPRTGARVNVTAKKILYFTPCKKLKDALVPSTAPQ